MTTQPNLNDDRFVPQGPAAYTSTGGNLPPVRPTPPARPRNRLAIAAIVVAVLGFIFAVWEGAYLLGWVLLPIAFILSLVALGKPGKPKKMAAAALVISIVGTVAGVIAFTTSTAKVVNDAFGGDTTVSSAPVAGPSEEAPGSDAPASDDQGTRTNPYPLGTTVSNTNWEVTVNSYTPEATSKVMAVNRFNEKPDAGHDYALVNVTATYLGETSGTAMEIGANYVSSAGNVITSYDKLATAPDALGTQEMYAGASVTGNIALHVPTDDSGTLRIRPGILGDEVFFSTN